MAHGKNTCGAPLPSWNAYRPSYSPSPPLSSHRRRIAPSPARSPPGPRLTLHRDEAVDNLIARTARAYDLVVAYERDSEGGTRWSGESIAEVYDMGKYLHEDIHDLRHCETALKNGERQMSVEEVQNKTEKLLDNCEQIQALIKSTERVPLRQRITRVSDSRPMANEEGGRQMDVDNRENLRQNNRHARSPRSQRDSGRRYDKRRNGNADTYRPHQDETSRRSDRSRILGRLGNHVLHD